MPSRMLTIKQSGGWRTTLIEVLLDQTAWTVVINIAHFISVGALSGGTTIPSFVLRICLQPLSLLWLLLVETRWCSACCLTLTIIVHHFSIRQQPDRNLAELAGSSCEDTAL